MFRASVVDIQLDKVAVLGDGITGRAVREYLHAHGFAPVPPTDAEVLVVSPGIHPSHYPSTPAIVMSEIEFAYQMFKKKLRPPKLVAVTGTNGKSTITSMIGHILDAPISGNIGRPFIACADLEDPIIIVEVSSYQLETVIEFSPSVSVVSNITPDHLERHGTMAAYAAAKSRVFMNQLAKDVLVAHGSDVMVQSIITQCPAQQVLLTPTSELTLTIARLAAGAQANGNARGLIGSHNHLNGAMAVAASVALGWQESDAIEKLLSYLPLPHRMEWVRHIDGRDFFNDSKATNPESTLVAVSSFASPVHLLLGGKDKGLEMAVFLQQVNQMVASITVYGEIGDRIIRTLDNVSCTIPVKQVDTLDAATLWAFEHSDPGSVILLSPACSSFDQFTDFNHRGDHFKAYVHAIRSVSA
ncbi:UDP-N-acetylmuramoyl-L-alanine--D-glutamate ligase [bacterium]|nr:UDP-N-acetylmuramoyl-L-alanine--D-glutamate ligase [bacterium]